MKQILKNIRLALTNLADERVHENTKRLFKDNPHQKIRFLGIKPDVVRRVAKEQFAAVKDMSKEEVFSLCESLWQSNYFEETSIACEWVYRFRRDFKPSDFTIFESWVERYITNWASCDSFCTHTVGTFLEMYPRHITKLKQWAKSSNLWMRRAAAVSLIVPARKKLFHKEVLDIATILLHDDEDLVQKGYGWMLKAASESNQDAVFQFVIKHKATMPRTALRYAIEKMPQHLKKEAMAKDTAKNE